MILKVGGFILEIDSNGAVFSCRFGGVAHVSPLWHRVSNVLRYGVGNILKFQENCDGIRASPLNPLECGIIRGGTVALQRYLTRYLVKAPFPVREIGTVMTLLHAGHVP